MLVHVLRIAGARTHTRWNVDGTGGGGGGGDVLGTRAATWTTTVTN